MAATPTIVVPPLDFVIDRREKGVGWPMWHQSRSPQLMAQVNGSEAQSTPSGEGCHSLLVRRSFPVRLVEYEADRFRVASRWDLRSLRLEGLIPEHGISGS